MELTYADFLDLFEVHQPHDFQEGFEVREDGVYQSIPPGLFAREQAELARGHPKGKPSLPLLPFPCTFERLQAGADVQGWNPLKVELRVAMRILGEEKELRPTERNTLLTLVKAMAIGGYKYDPMKKRSAVPNEIAKDSEGTISENSVRKWLREAFGYSEQERAQ